jgi:signal transduction histidine kinase
MKNKISMPQRFEQKIKGNAELIFKESYINLCKDNDRVFTLLLAIQWIAAIFIAFYYTPRTWIGAQDLVNVHVYAAILIGGLLSIYPIYLNIKYPGHEANRYINVIAQGLYSVLFIHLTGGRIETHFHVFGSLAFFAFYRDLKVLLVGTIVVTIDHVFRGIWFPQSVFGIITQSEWRWLEHAGWVMFEDFFLAYSCIRGIKEMKIVSLNRAEIIMQNEHAEEIIILRTDTIKEQQMHLAHSAKMSAIGEMAGGIAHEINNPLAIISANCSYLKKLIEKENYDPIHILKSLEDIQRTTLRMAKIVQGLKTLSRDTTNEEFGPAKLRDIIDDVHGLCSEKFKNNGVDFRIDLNEEIYDQIINCRRVQISQIFLNLLGNAFDAVEGLNECWIKVECKKIEQTFEFRITDSGNGISKDIQEKIFLPFFTTKPVGKGTGLGLSLSSSILRDHAGSFSIDNNCPNTCFIMTLPSARKAA